MLRSNILLSLSILQASIAAEVSNLVQFCSNCTYPVAASQPYKEEKLFDGQPHPLNKGYAAAKLAALHAGQCAETEGLIKVFHPIPCSLFGLHDNYSLTNSHFVAAVIRKLHSATLANNREIIFWGTGRPYREFMFADHLVEAIDTMLENSLSYKPVNIGTGIDTPIKQVIDYICTLSNFQGQVIWDHSKPDGAIHKLLDSSLIYSHGWKPKFDLFTSLSHTYEYYSSHQDIIRL